jgi:4-aminobutyrate aminotransferase-like enzyme/Ser/Thr protein kinase RdoA (MazF antagonist)
MQYNTIKITTYEAEKILNELYGLKGVVTPLPGEIDFNFRVKKEESEGFILKVSRPNEDDSYLDFQQKLLQHLEEKEGKSRILKNKEGRSISEFTDQAGNLRKVRLLPWVSGRVWSKVNPQLDDLRFSLGEKCGSLTKALQGFDHPKAHRNIDWDVAQSLWTKEHMDLFKGEQKTIISGFQKQFEKAQDSNVNLRKSVVQGDANDNNIIVSSELINPSVKAIVDFGDAVYTQIINDLAIACAYAIMNHPDPLAAALPIVKGYHSKFALEASELEHLYNAIAMRLVISVTKSAINKTKEPDNSYLQISEKSAWKLLEKWSKVNAQFALYSFRIACGYKGHPSEETFKNFTQNATSKFSDLFPTIKRDEIHLLDLKVSSTWMGSKVEFNNLDLFQFKIDQLQKQHPSKLIAGGYCEPRPLYTSSAYDKEGNNGPQSRTFHLGIDFWLPEGTPVHTLFDGEIFTSTNDAGFKEYGGLIILKHCENDLTFYTLHGHLSIASTELHKVGDKIKKGDCIGYLGNTKENGEWAPHLHFQIMLSMLDYTLDFPGVTYFNQLEVWKSICLDPNLLFKNKDLVTNYGKDEVELIAFRKEHLGKSLSLSYDQPLHIVRGEGVYLIDAQGRKYLDTANNVNHVGHQHPKVVAAGQKQMSLLNTNTRYLHDEIVAYTEALLKKLPQELSVLHIVNSGSEANELALRMAKACTGQNDMLAIEVGYHGNTNAVMEVSSYKFDGKGGSGKPETTHILPLPDSFRGKYTGDNSGSEYATHAKQHIDHLKSSGKGIAGFIGESMISCGGQIEPPKNYFKEVYKHVREAGGICIADEVQTGFGRMGKSFWAFELYDVIPDIVTMGKPAGNGHPLAIVACTKEVAEKFSNDMEFFNTFGGNPVSCAIGRTVLEVIEEEKLQQNALEVGGFLKNELKALQNEFPIIGDVRGEGLFLGFELNTSEKKPLANHASYLANRMKTLGILMSTDGPYYNVLKIKPPMVFSEKNAKELIIRLKTVFTEDFMRNF